MCLCECVRLISDAIFNWAIKLTKKVTTMPSWLGKRDLKSVSSSSRLIMFALDVQQTPRAASVMKRYSFNPQLKLGENLTQMLHYSLWIFLKSCRCGKVNDAHISLIETLQMLQIRQTDAVVHHLVQFLKLGNKKFSTQIHPKARIHFCLKIRVRLKFVGFSLRANFSTRLWIKIFTSQNIFITLSL